MTHNQKALLLHLLVDVSLTFIGILISHFTTITLFGGPDKFMIWYLPLFIGCGIACICEDVDKYLNLRNR